jgi:magnesium chelatase subunit D
MYGGSSLLPPGDIRWGDRMAANPVFPFSAIVGQEQMKLALVLNAVDPLIGGVLIQGERGTAKSTSVRAFASLLPEIDVITNCPYSCDPGNQSSSCRECRDAFRRGEIPGKTGRKIRVVDLPLNATEDMVLGCIDFSHAVKEGGRSFQPGLLARANRGIIYIDEINLLDDHIVDVILDAASSRINVVEREGISFRHSSGFLLVATMNPEEGELRPQLLDRFGLSVRVVGEKAPEKRVELMELKEMFDADLCSFRNTYSVNNKIITGQIRAARSIIKSVQVPSHLRKFISELCLKNNVAGHRADIVISRASAAMASFNEHREVTMEDIKAVAPMVLLHRKRMAMPPQLQSEKETQEKMEQDGNSRGNRDQMEFDSTENSGGNRSGKGPEGDLRTASESGKTRDMTFEIGDTFKVRSISSGKDRTLRRGSGRRSRARTSQKQGRYVKSVSQRGTGDIALDATLRFAAPYQKARVKPDGLAVAIKEQDIREKVREKKVGNFFLFIVDGSGSMAARKRMAAVKGAIMSLLMDIYQKRDRIAMTVFRKSEASVYLPPTSSVEFAGKRLKELEVGGRTPLSQGLVKGYELLGNFLWKDAAARPIAVIITDGKANEAMGANKPYAEALGIAEKMALETRVKYIVVDTEEAGIVTLGLARNLAIKLKGDYFKIDDLKADKLAEIVRRTI